MVRNPWHKPFATIRLRAACFIAGRTSVLEGAKQSFAFGEAAEQKRRADKVAELERLVGKLTMQLEIAKKASHYVKSLPPESES